MGICSVVLEWGRERGNHRRLGTFVLSFFLSTLSGAGNAFSTVTSILATQSVVPAAGINIWDLVRNAECQTPPKIQWTGIFISVLEKQSSRKSYPNLLLWCYESSLWKREGISLLSQAVSSGICLWIQCELCNLGTEKGQSRLGHTWGCVAAYKRAYLVSQRALHWRDWKLPARKPGKADMSITQNRISKLTEILRSNLAVTFLVKSREREKKESH